MLKTVAMAGLFALAFAVPAFADDMAKCDDATMMKVDDAIKADTDPAMKNDVDMATKEMDMAKMAMKDGKMDDCSMHIGNAMKSMMMKQ
jgi:hypothetical protein